MACLPENAWFIVEYTAHTGLWLFSGADLTTLVMNSLLSHNTHLGTKQQLKPESLDEIRIVVVVSHLKLGNAHRKYDKDVIK